MPRIFDNIDQHLHTALQKTLAVSDRSDFCVGYFNLRGWKQLDSYIERWSGKDGERCRLLVGMQRPPQKELREVLSITKSETIDQKTAHRLKKKLAEEFREQLTIGIPTNEDEAGLRRLAAQIRARKVVVKLFLRHPLHAKLYLLFRPDPINPIVGYLGSSNLTLAGLSRQGELNVDVLDHDACLKLEEWFEDRWNDRWGVDISDELVKIIDESWAREKELQPYHIYLKMAYHLSQEARAGLSEFRIPKDFGNKLFDYQTAAVKIAAHHLNKRGGVLIGDVVGLGKTLMAVALARIFEDDHSLETLIICPKNLVKMWEDYRDQYRLRARVLSITQVAQKLPEIQRFRLVIIDESHNLRNRQGKRYRAIQEYVQKNESKCILLSATPYNKTYLDLANQLRLFLLEDRELGIRPEQYLRTIGEEEFIRRHQCSVRTLAAFEKSEHPDDWCELMRLFMVRRTRSFIQENYAREDPETGRRYLTFEDGSRSYFPERRPITIEFELNDHDASDQYARLYAPDIVDTINALNLPRYGLGNYVAAKPHHPPTSAESKLLDDLSRAGKRLMGFCRTNLFKRLESSGQAFMLSIERHILRNYVFLHALETGDPIPIGTQDAAFLDARVFDEDADDVCISGKLFENNNEEECSISGQITGRTVEAFKKRAAEIYSVYASQYKKRFDWIPSAFFVKSLKKDLENDAIALLDVLKKCGAWDPDKDAKLSALTELLTQKHPHEKVIIFSQFADTVRYLEKELKERNVPKLSGVSGDSSDPTALAWRFSPESNQKRDRISADDELNVLIATDVLSEGQNLQDCSIVVNYDLPWAIIRLIQRAGRVDRIGQKAENILCYSFLPAEGIDRIIHLRTRVRKRLKENAEVVGTDEAFFEDDADDQAILDLYNEKAGILDDEAESDVDLASYAYQIWKNAIDREPRLKKIIAELPDVAYSTRAHQEEPGRPEGVLLYMRTAEGNDALAWMDKNGESVTQSQFAILRAAKCEPDIPPIPRHEKHHELVRKGVEHLTREERSVGGQLGRPRGARFRTYERLKHYAETVKGTLFETEKLLKAIEDIYRNPLRESAKDTLNRQLRSGISDEDLLNLVTSLRDGDRLTIQKEDVKVGEPRIICSLGLFGEEPLT